MKIKLPAIALFLTAALGSSCFSSGHEVDQNKVDQIKRGVTTKAEVREWLGAPEQISRRDSGDETWIYMYMHSSMKAQSFIPYVGMLVGGSNTENQNTTVSFNSDGVVTGLNTSYGGTSADSNLSAGGKPKTP